MLSLWEIQKRNEPKLNVLTTEAQFAKTSNLKIRRQTLACPIEVPTCKSLTKKGKKRLFTLFYLQQLLPSMKTKELHIQFPYMQT